MSDIIDQVARVGLLVREARVFSK